MHSAVTPPSFAGDYEDSSPEDRHDLVRGLLQSVRRGESRDAALALATSAGWERDFAAWVYTKVQAYGEFEILPPLDDRVRVPKTSASQRLSNLVGTLALVGGFVVAWYLFSLTVGALLVPTMFGIAWTYDRVKRRWQPTDSEWGRPR